MLSSGKPTIGIAMDSEAPELMDGDGGLEITHQVVTYYDRIMKCHLKEPIPPEMQDIIECIQDLLEDGAYGTGELVDALLKTQQALYKEFGIFDQPPWGNVDGLRKWCRIVEPFIAETFNIYY